MSTIRFAALIAPSLVLVAAIGVSLGALGQVTPPGRAIFSCTDASGKRLTSDRLIAECVGREQRVLNPDGSFNRIVPPTLTVEERNQLEARERDTAAAREAKREAVRRDRNLLARYPNEAAHRKARDAALENGRKLLASAEARLVTLAGERKPLLAEAEFYAGKTLPPKLKAQLDANDVSVDAQRLLIQNQQAEMARIDKGYDAELDRLKQVWAGAPQAVSASASAPRK